MLSSILVARLLRVVVLTPVIMVTLLTSKNPHIWWKQCCVDFFLKLIEKERTDKVGFNSVIDAFASGICKYSYLSS